MPLVEDIEVGIGCEGGDLRARQVIPSNVLDGSRSIAAGPLILVDLLL